MIWDTSSNAGAVTLVCRPTVISMGSYSAAKMLAEAGCSTHQIAAITGHATLAMVQKYSKAAEQRRLASEAMAKPVENERAT